ncbi:hypothetical protein B0T19DRAFT_412533 [Cercophora scortea]|uniref:Secreted protein n=1 Tax=Cercophora scortea TaxID=314031 RepID=A0AAE0J5Q3_9PEZI|nr:hypothetical protein B0T19DRAFT_412533 [Cercophora scortea]
MIAAWTFHLGACLHCSLPLPVLCPLSRRPMQSLKGHADADPNQAPWLGGAATASWLSEERLCGGMERRIYGWAVEACPPCRSLAPVAFGTQGESDECPACAIISDFQRSMRFC